jgi:hypothetical protein
MQNVAQDPVAGLWIRGKRSAGGSPVGGTDA